MNNLSFELALLAHPFTGAPLPARDRDVLRRAASVLGDRDAWLRFGVEAGYCSPAVCSTHDGTPTTEVEDESFEQGDDPCVFVVRPYRDVSEAAAVEVNHPPSVWRKT